LDLLDQSFHRYVEVLIDFTFPYHDKADAIGAFMFRLQEMDQPLEHFDERLWMEQLTGSPFLRMAVCCSNSRMAQNWLYRITVLVLTNNSQKN